MRFNIVYLDDVTECQGQLFVEAVDKGIDIDSFITYYMTSDIRKKIDMGDPKHCNLFGDELFELLDTSKLKAAKEEQDGFMAEWLGEFYSQLQWKSGISSKDLIKKVQAEKMIRAYGGIHDLDMDLAVQRVMNQAGIKEET